MQAILPFRAAGSQANNRPLVVANAHFTGEAGTVRGELARLATRGVAGRRLPQRLAQLVLGLTLYGLSGALQVRSGLGLDPWDVLHQGVAAHLGWQIGTVVIAVGALVLLLWWPLRQRPGVGTVSNVVLVGLAMDASLDLLPAHAALAVRVIEMAAGVTLCGVATGLYIGADLGPGPRDGLMTGLVRRTGRSIRLVRTALEVTVLAVGWALGGTVGLGTVLFAVAIGPLVQLFLPLFDSRCARATSPAAAPHAVEPC